MSGQTAVSRDFKAMRRRIAVSQLRVGMLVCGHEARKGGRRFVLRSFRIRSSDEIAVLQRYFDFLYVESDAGAATDAGPAGVPLTEVPAGVPDADELAAARRVLSDTRTVVEGLLSDIRFGRSVDLPRVRESVSSMLHSILQNRNALLFLTQLNNTDQDLAQRAVNVAVLVLVFGRSISVPKKDLEDLGLAGLLVDLGMMLVPPAIRNKPGPLSESEYRQVKGHVDLGYRLLERGPALPELIGEVMRTHHERFDGTGYPGGLAGRAIGLYSRMTAIVSVYVALTSRRSYARALSLKHALSHLYAESDRAFDGRLVQKFIRCIGVYPPGSVVRLSDGRGALVMAANESDRLRPVVRTVDSTGDLVDLEAAENHAIRIEGVLGPDEFQAWISEDGTPRVVLTGAASDDT